MTNEAASAGGPEVRSVRTLARGLQVLDLFADQRSLTQSAIAAQTGLPMPTVHRLVSTLLQHGYLQIDSSADRTLRLGPAAGRLADRPVEGDQDAVRRAIRDLSEATGETVNLATLAGATIVYLDGVAGTRLLTPKAVVGTRLPAHCTALGKALLAQLADDEVVERLGTGPYARLTEHTVEDWAALRHQLDRVRSEGLAYSDQEFEIGLVSLAVPATRRDGPLLAVNVSLPSARATASFRSELADRLQAAVGLG